MARLHAHCHALQAQVDRLASAQRKKAAARKKGWSGCWTCWFGSGDGGGSEAVEKVDRPELSVERPTPARRKQGTKILRTASL